MPSVLTVENLSKRFGARDVLRGVSFQLERGEAVALTGENGSGKTTLLKMLAFLLRPSAGTFSWRGDDEQNTESRTQKAEKQKGDSSRLPATGYFLQVNSLDYRRRLGFLGHETMLYGDLTVEQNLLFMATLYGAGGEAKESAKRAMEAWGLAPFRAYAARALSRGLARRAALARATLHDPDVYLLDEPTGDLDAARVERLASWMESERRAGKTFLFSEHHAAFAERVSTRTLRLTKGGNLEEERGK